MKANRSLQSMPSSISRKLSGGVSIRFLIAQAILSADTESLLVSTVRIVNVKCKSSSHSH